MGVQFVCVFHISFHSLLSLRICLIFLLFIPLFSVVSKISWCHVFLGPPLFFFPIFFVSLSSSILLMCPSHLSRPFSIVSSMGMIGNCCNWTYPSLLHFNLTYNLIVTKVTTLFMFFYLTRSKGICRFESALCTTQRHEIFCKQIWMPFKSITKHFTASYNCIFDTWNLHISVYKVICRKLRNSDDHPQHFWPESLKYFYAGSWCNLPYLRAYMCFRIVLYRVFI